MQKHFLILFLWLGSVLYLANIVAGPHPDISIAELERYIHQQINRERQNYDLAPLKSDSQLAAIARHHSQDMAAHHFFSHTNLQGEEPADRCKRQGWDKQKPIAPETLALGVAENLYLTHLYDQVFTAIENGMIVNKEYQWKTRNQIVQNIVQGWMNSPSHRKNILSPQYDRQGIGVAISGNDIYITEDLF